MKKQIHKNTKGFTILEVLVAMLIVAVGIAATGTLMVSIIRSNSISNHMSQATQLAEVALEEIRQSGYFLSLDVNAAATTETIILDEFSFTRVVDAVPTVKSDGTTEVEGSKTFNVRVSFSSFGTHDVELNTIISR